MTTSTDTMAAAGVLATWWGAPAPQPAPDAPEVEALGRALGGEEELAVMTGAVTVAGLVEDYDRLFGGMQPPCPPVESAWRSTGRAARNTAATAPPDGPSPGSPPEHVASQWRAVEQAAAAGSEDVTQQLLRDLASWLPRLCEAVDREGDHPWWPALARLTELWTRALAP